MTDQTNPERGAEQTSAELPIPKLETPSPASSPSSVDTDAIVKKVADELRKEIRMAQSTKDREVKAIKERLGIGDLAELEAMGVTIPDNVKHEYRFRQLEGKPGSDSSGQQPSSSGSGAALTEQEVSEVVGRLKLNANDADVIEKLRGTYRNRDHFEATMTNLALTQATRQPPSASSASALVSSGTTEPADLLVEYNAKATKVRGNALIELKMEYRKKGLDIN